MWGHHILQYVTNLFWDKIILLWWPRRQFLTGSIPQHIGVRRNAPWSCHGGAVPAFIQSPKCRGRKKFVALKREVVGSLTLSCSFNLMLSFWFFDVGLPIYMHIYVPLFRFCLIPLGSSLLKISWVSLDIIQPISRTFAQLSKFYPVIRTRISSQSQVHLYVLLTTAICFSFWPAAFITLISL